MKKTRILAATTLMTFLGFSQMEAKNDIGPFRLDLNEIEYIEEEVNIDLGFDHYQYLPEGFNAYDGMKLDLDDIEYIECEEEIKLDFNTDDFLPADFNPYST